MGRAEKGWKASKRAFLVITSLKPGHVPCFQCCWDSRCMHRTHKGCLVPQFRMAGWDRANYSDFWSSLHGRTSLHWKMPVFHNFEVFALLRFLGFLCSSLAAFDLVTQKSLNVEHWDLKNFGCREDFIGCGELVFFMELLGLDPSIVSWHSSIIFLMFYGST
jgi:hypothetical protein